MQKLYAAAVLALGTALIACYERTAQSVPKTSQVSEVSGQPASTSSESQEAPDSVQLPSDSLVVTDTAGQEFSRDDLNAVKSALETRLHSDEFIATSPAQSYGHSCRFYDSTSMRRYTADERRFAYVRPRLLKIAFLVDDHYVRTVSGTAEVTRVALVQRGVDGKWYGKVEVSRDTVSLLVSSSVKDSTWTVCEKPAHSNSWNSNGMDMPASPWLPIRAAETERMTIAWDDNFNASRLRQLADSVSKLSATVVVEGNPEPKMPMIYKDVCPGEGCEFGEWLTCDTLRVFSQAGKNPKTAFMLHRGDKFTAVTGDVHLEQAGMVVFHSIVKVNEEGLNFIFTPADTLYPLLYEGEGFGSWYFRGKERGGFFFFGNGGQDAADISVTGGVSGYEVVRPIISDWWVKVRAKDGREGWIKPSGSIFGLSPHYEDMPKACPGEKAG